MVRNSERNRVMARNSEKEREGVRGTARWPVLARKIGRDREGPCDGQK